MVRRAVALALWATLSRATEFGLELNVELPPSLSSFSEASFEESTSFDDGNMTMTFDERDDFMALVERQSRCPAGSSPCGAGRCCYNHQTCVQNGCCPGGQQQCGSRNCYPPATHFCCSHGNGACPRGSTCISNNRCCPSGQSECGTGRCYSPRTQVCCGDGSTCPRGHDCIRGGGCCPSGQVPCPDDRTKCYNPRTQRCCTAGGRTFGCSRSASCCESGQCYDSSSSRCCKNGICDRDSTCCERQCCRSGAYCGGGGFCSVCPASTRTVMSTYRPTRTTTRVVTVTASTSRSSTSGFSCEAMTATNDFGDELVLGTDCMFTLSGGTSSSSSARNGKREETEEDTHPTGDGYDEFDNVPASVEAEPTSPPELDDAPQELLRRQAGCSATRTITSTVVTTIPTTTTTTSSRTTSPLRDLTFSCLETAVTNDVSDILSIDGTCGLHFTPGPQPTGSSNGGGGGGGGDADGQGGGDDDDAAAMLGKTEIWAWLVAMAAALAL